MAPDNMARSMAGLIKAHTEGKNKGEADVKMKARLSPGFLNLLH